MIFSTSIFLFLFLPVFLLVYYLLPFRFRSVWILLASYVFYGWWRLDFLLVFAATTLFSFGIGRVIEAQRERPRRARAALTLGIVGNLVVLAYFKYFNFGIESLNALLGSVGASSLNAWQVILPIGISFYVFQATSYIVDVYRRDVPAGQNFFDVAAFVSLFRSLSPDLFCVTKTWRRSSPSAVTRRVNLPKAPCAL